VAPAGLSAFLGLARVRRWPAAVALALATTCGAAGPSCTGRYVLTRATGKLVAGPGDALVLDPTTAVLDPACGAGVVGARLSHGRWRIATQWSDCRGARHLQLKLRASADCTLLRGRVRAGRHASRFVAITSTCGDAVVDPGRGETCDDGNLADGDGCDSTCGACAQAPDLTSSWDAIQTNVFDRACTTCHGAALTASLDLRAPGSFARIVDVEAPDTGGLLLIAPGDRNASFIWLKIAKATFGDGDDLPGAGMPIGLSLRPSVVEALGRWIDAGAPETGLVPGADALLDPCPSQ
jgi:cysteine-rich repeat protein